MNYPSFLKAVDRLAAGAGKDSLRSFIHEIARTVPESDRQRFLGKMTEYCDAAGENLQSQKNGEESLADRVDSLLEALREIQDEDRALESEYNEEWDDWRDDEEDEFKYTDPEDILEDIAEAVELLHDCLDQEEYEKGTKLAQKLSELTIQVFGDYDGTMNIGDLILCGLLDIDLEKTAKEAVYLTCMGSTEAERAEAMLTVMDQFGVHSLSLEKILQSGPDEIDLDALLPSWIKALGERKSPAADFLLAEAQDMLHDKDAVLENASRYAQTHPVLYQNILRDGLEGTMPEEMLQIGLQGMKEVPLHRMERSSISLFTAKYALDTGNSRTAEECWIEAFRTSPTVVNYLRPRLLSQSWEEYADTARGVYDSYYASKSLWEKKPWAALMFFDERFEEMIRHFMKPGEGIGWSSTFMKEGIALMLMLLNSGTESRPGIAAMKSTAYEACSFDAESFCEGTDLAVEHGKEDLFLKCFQRWKSQIVLPEAVENQWMEKINSWIALRVSAIMNANRRNYYGECAAFIAAYGEVLESRGKIGKKERLMQEYKAEYSRRRAFHEELRRFGMRK